MKKKSAYASLAGRLDVTGEIRRQSLIPSIETFGDDEGCGAENNPCILPPIIVECNPGYDPECDEPEQPGGGGTYDGDWGDPGPAPCNPYFDSTCSGSGGGGAPCTNCNPPPATAPTGVPQEWYNTLTPAEKQLVWNSPLIDVYRVMAARDRAFEEAPQITPIGPHNGPQDAVRHALWSAYMANSMGAVKAKAWGDAHEDYPENPPDEKQMDLYNNQIGRQIGTTHSRDDIFEAVRAALQSGQLQTSLGAGGGGGGGDCGMLLCRQ